MKKFVAILLLVVAVTVHGDDERQNIKFEQFKRDYSKVYATPDEQEIRREIFSRNLNFINWHNSGVHSYTVGVNQFADLTPTEFGRQFLNAPFLSRSSVDPQSSLMRHTNTSVQDLPDSVDWVAKGAVTPPMDQGQCGASWAIPVVSAIEGQHAIYRKDALLALSVQQLIDCCDPDGNRGCNGGIVDDGYKCVIRMGGIDTAASYPYNGDGDEKCKFNTKTIGEKIRGFVDIASNEAALQNAIANVGPVAAGIDASQSSFQFYTSGVYDEPACSVANVDHGVTVVGYGALNGVDYWKVKNSWGTAWGMDGYILMSRNKNDQCGIASVTSYPVL